MHFAIVFTKKKKIYIILMHILTQFFLYIFIQLPKDRSRWKIGSVGYQRRGWGHIFFLKQGLCIIFGVLKSVRLFELQKGYGGEKRGRSVRGHQMCIRKYKNARWDNCVFENIKKKCQTRFVYILGVDCIQLIDLVIFSQKFIAQSQIFEWRLVITFCR